LYPPRRGHPPDAVAVVERDVGRGGADGHRLVVAHLRELEREEGAVRRQEPRHELVVVLDRHVQPHLDRHERAEHRQRPANEAEEDRPHQVELLLHAEAPEVSPTEDVRVEPEREVREKEEVESQARIAHRPHGARVDLRERVDLRRREPDRPRDDDPQNEDDGVVERPDAKRPPRVEPPERDDADPGALSEEQQRDEVPREDEEDLHALPAEARHLVAVEVVEAHPLLRLFRVIDEHSQRRQRAKPVEPRELAACRHGRRD